MKQRTYCFDIDGTICTNTYGDYEHALPFADRVAYINSLYKSGNTIIFFTARGSTTGIDWFQVTQDQLATWGVRYHKLIMGKPYADIYIDDKAIQDSDFFLLCQE